jgi:hypothetical protein
MFWPLRVSRKQGPRLKAATLMIPKWLFRRAMIPPVAWWSIITVGILIEPFYRLSNKPSTICILHMHAVTTKSSTLGCLKSRAQWAEKIQVHITLFYFGPEMWNFPVSYVLTLYLWRPFALAIACTGQARPLQWRHCSHLWAMGGWRASWAGSNGGPRRWRPATAGARLRMSAALCWRSSPSLCALEHCAPIGGLGVGSPRTIWAAARSGAPPPFSSSWPAVRRAWVKLPCFVCVTNWKWQPLNRISRCNEIRIYCENAADMFAVVSYTNNLRREGFETNSTADAM